MLAAREARKPGLDGARPSTIFSSTTVRRGRDLPGPPAERGNVICKALLLEE